MSNIIPFESAGLPAHLANYKPIAADLTSGVGAGYPVLSIKGKVWTLVIDGDRKIITRPDDPSEPASKLDLVIIAGSPKLSKVWYAKGFEEGSKDKPDCSSNDGVTPDAGLPNVQAKSCAACPHNVWGTGVGGKGKACSDARRVAVAATDDLKNPMLLRVPPASLKPLAEYASQLDKRKVGYDAVVSIVGFEVEESTPKLKFNWPPRGFLTAEQYAAVQEIKGSDVVAQILGTQPTVHTTAAGDIPGVNPTAAEPVVTKSEVEAAIAAAAPAPTPAPAPEPEPPREPEEGDMVTVTTAKGEVVQGKLLELDDLELTVRVGDALRSFVRSKVKMELAAAPATADKPKRTRKPKETTPEPTPSAPATGSVTEDLDDALASILGKKDD